jgi:hypothetical protein
VALNRYRSAPQVEGSVMRISVGDVVSRQQIRAVLRIRFAVGALGETATVRAAIRGTGVLADGVQATLDWTYASHADNDAQARDRDVDRMVGALYAARARAVATEANRTGDFERAEKVLRTQAGRIAKYANGDPELEATVAQLREELPRFTTSIMERSMQKRMYHESASQLKDRDAQGRARR